MDLFDKQIQIIEYVKKCLKKADNENIITPLSGFCYFPIWSETPGHAKIKFWLNGWSFSLKFLFILLKNILAIASNSKYFVYNNYDSSKKYNTLILSWAFKENFQTDGSFIDKYFNENSKNLLNSHWVLISMDDYVPLNLNKNITLIKKKKTFFKYNFLYLAKIFVLLVIESRFSLKKVFHYFSYHSYFAKQISLIVKKILKKNNYKTIFMPYEAQPFHQFVISEAKSIDKKIRTIGYFHSMLPAIPCDFVYRSGAPDLLLVHGESLAEVFQSKLSWPKNKLLLIESLRFRSDENRSLSKKIYLPYILDNKKILIKEFKKLLINSSKENFPKLEIKIHQANLNSKKHLVFKNELEKIMEVYKDNFSNNPPEENISIFFGVTTSIFEALESGTKVIHICSDPLLQSFDEKMWPNLKTKKLNNFTFSYNLVFKGKYINFGSKENTLTSTLENIL
jgi:hypothetical protein